MVRVSWATLLALLRIFNGIDGMDLSIGILQDGSSGNTSVENQTIGQINVTFIRRSALLTDPFHFLRAVRQLDLDISVEIIVVLANVKLGTLDERVLVTSNKPMIYWGRTPLTSLQIISPVAQAPTTERQCDVHNVHNVGARSPRRQPQGLYCVNNLAELTFLRNGTLLEQVALIGANILSTLVTRALHWTLVYIFHDNTTEMEAYSLVKQVSSRGVLVVAYNIDTTPNLFDVLLNIYDNVTLSSSNINGIVLCQFACLRRFFWEANNFDVVARGGKTLLKQLSRWLVASYGHVQRVTDTLVSCADDLDNVAIVALPDNSNRSVQQESKRLGMCVDFTKINGPSPSQWPQSDQGHNSVWLWDKIMSLYGIKTWPSHAGLLLSVDQDFNKNFRKMILEYEIFVNSPEEDTEYIFNSTLLEYATDRLQALASYTPCEALKIETLMWRTGGREFSNVGYVSMDGEVVTFSDLFPNTKFGYNKRRFLVSTLHYPPFVLKTVMPNGTVKFEGMCMDLLKELAINLNFTYNLTEPPDKMWGSPGPNNTFNGMIGQLQREEVDIVAADISIQKAREMVMDFAFPFYYGDTSVLLKKPDPNARKWRTLLDPFKPKVLMAVGILLPVVSLLAFLFEKFNPYYKNQSSASVSTDAYRLNTLVDAFWYMYGALLCQGGVNLPESQAGRTFVSCWWLFCIVLVGTYCGNLIAFLTVTKDKPPFNTLEEMTELKKEYTWGTQAGTNWEHVFKTSTRKEFRKVGDLMIEFNKSDPTVMSPDFDIQLDKVKQGGYGWIGKLTDCDTVIIEVEMAKDCDLMMIKERFLPLKYAFGFTNNSPHQKIFSEQMLSIHESGLLQVWKRRWWPKSTLCGKSTLPEAKAISIIDVQSAFYVAAGGALIGFVAFLFELLVAKIRHNKCPQPDISHVNSNTAGTDDIEERTDQLSKPHLAIDT